MMAASPNSQLVTMGIARAISGKTADAIHCEMESGTVRFVWNIGSGNQIATPRIWLRALVEPASVARMTLPEVIAAILGTQRNRWRGVEVAQMLMVSRPQIHRLRKVKALPGTISGHTFWVTRPTLERFFVKRFLG